MLTINGPQKLNLSAEQVAIVLDALSEKPYKIVAPVFQEIIRQLQSNAVPSIPLDKEKHDAGARPAEDNHVDSPDSSGSNSGNPEVGK